MSRGSLEAHFVVERSDSFRVEISLSVPAGTTVALLGPNGAGKSTVVAALAGLLPIAEGHIHLDDRVLDAPAVDWFVPPSQRRVGVVFQDHLLFPHLDVVENVAFGLRSGGLGREPARKLAEEWLRRVGLEGLGHRLPHQLSGGQAQRAALARALVTTPDLLLLDEPLSALDAGTRVIIRRELADHLEAFAGPRLLVTHDPLEAFLLADRIWVLEEGRVTQVGTADDIRLRPRTTYVADLAGVNLFHGIAVGGVVGVGGHFLHIADVEAHGEVLLTVSPNAVSVHRQPPGGSPRNAWATDVAALEDLGSRVRLSTGGPLPMTVELTAEATRELEVSVGSSIWVAVKATEIGVEGGPAPVGDGAPLRHP